MKGWLLYMFDVFYIILIIIYYFAYHLKNEYVIKYN